jgi:Fe-S-cluster formation regulator IscX/YfhJ
MPLMGAITPEQARAYLERWDLVREAEAVELQRTPMAIKFRQLDALMASRDAFRDDPQREQEIESVRQRWAGLRKALGA